MGKKDKNKKKGQGAAKTAEKTERKLCRFMRSVYEDRPPSHRASLTLTSHPEGSHELVHFGGEFHDGRTTQMYADLYFYNCKRRSWSRVTSPRGPPPRSSHQCCAVPGQGGRIFVFGGEFTSPSESQFHHYKDLWCFHLATKRWEKIT